VFADECPCFADCDTGGGTWPLLTDGTSRLKACRGLGARWCNKPREFEPGECESTRACKDAEAPALAVAFVVWDRGLRDCSWRIDSEPTIGLAKRSCDCAGRVSVGVGPPRRPLEVVMCEESGGDGERSCCRVELPAATRLHLQVEDSEASDEFTGRSNGWGGNEVAPQPLAVEACEGSVGEKKRLCVCGVEGCCGDPLAPRQALQPVPLARDVAAKPLQASGLIDRCRREGDRMVVGCATCRWLWDAGVP